MHVTETKHIKSVYMSGADFLEWDTTLNDDIFDSVEDSMRIRSNGDKLIKSSYFLWT